MDHPEVRRWRLFRDLYYFTLAILFIAIAFYLGPNRMMFGKWTSLDLDDFVPVVRDKCVPTVTAMKVFARAHGRLPETNEELGPAFKNWTSVGMVGNNGFHFLDFAHGMETLQYDFTPGDERWTVHGVFIKGVVPFPAVGDPPSTQP